jgi:hypothetical protein
MLNDFKCWLKHFFYNIIVLILKHQ